MEVVAGSPAGTARPPARRSFLPLFADDRNRQLDSQIRELEAQLEAAGVGIEADREHIKVLAEHLENVRLEIKHTQGHLTAKRKEVETEGHLQELSRREAGRLRADAAKLARQRAELEQRASGMRTEVFAAQERLDQFRLLMNWNQEEMDQWNAASRQKEADALALEKYRRQDEARVKELTMALERLTREAHTAQRALDDEITETQAVQGELSKAADDFRRLHAERQELLAQWEGVVAAVARRDGEIRAAGEELAEHRAAMLALQGELATAVAALDAEVAASAALGKQIAARERGIKQQYDAFAAEQAAAAETEDKLDLLTNTVAGAADEAAQAAAANGHLRAEVARRAVALEMAQQGLAAAQQALEAGAVQLGGVQQRLAELEALRQGEQQRAEGLDRQLAALAKQQFKAGQALHAAQEEARRLEGEIGGARAQGRNLSHRLVQLEGHMLRQQEVLYNVDFQLVQMERKVARAAGERTQDETAALTARIEALTAALDAARAEHSMLAGQVKQAEQDHVRAQRANQAVTKERAAVLDSMSRLEVESDATSRAVKAATREKEERLVEVDVWKLELRRLQGLLTSKSGEVLSLEHRKQALQLGMAERRSEVAVQMELMQGEARLLREDLSRVNRELKERQLALDKLRAKHETLVLKGRGQDGEGLQSQAYYIVKSAQERQELSDEAEQLAAAVEQAERECRALEGSLQRLAGCNHNLSQHYRFNASQERQEAQAAAKQALEEALQAVRLRQGEEAAKRADLEEAQARLQNLQAEEDHMRRLVQDLQAQRAEAQRQLAEQQERRSRAEQRTERLRRSLQAKAGFAAGSCSSGSGTSGRGGVAGGAAGALCGTRPGSAASARMSGTGGSRPGTGASAIPGRGSQIALPAGAASRADVEADVALTLLREGTKGMVEALRAVAGEHPELQVLQRVEATAGIRLAVEASSCALAGGAGSAGGGSTCGGSSRPMSALRAAGSARSAAGSARGSPRRPGSGAGIVGSEAGLAGTARSHASTKAAVCTVQLQL